MEDFNEGDQSIERSKDRLYDLEKIIIVIVIVLYYIKIIIYQFLIMNLI